MDTLSYDWRKNVRLNDPKTSKDAAKSAGRLAKTQHLMIVDVLRAGVALAAEQIADLLPGQPGIWRRMAELEREYLIEKTTETHTNRSGRKAIKYRLLEAV